MKYQHDLNRIVMRRDIFVAISHPVRRNIIMFITTKEKTLKCIINEFEITRQAVSKHIRVLIQCELIKSKKKGKEVYYKLEINKIDELKTWLKLLKN